jgi:tyrosyl-tRNA synthetase
MLLQAFDFYFLAQHYDCFLQMGGNDQWGNIVTGTELIRRKADGEAYALTTPLIKKADGTKFGKTEKGNVWLDPQKTSPYQFYQFWINVSDADAPNFIRSFTTKSKEEVAALVAEHETAPHLRLLQKALADEVTTRVHSLTDLQKAKETTDILFGSSFEDFKKLTAADIEDAFDASLTFRIDKSIIQAEPDAVSILGEHTSIYSSKGEARKAIAGNGVSINKQKISLDRRLSASDLLYGKYILVQKGKKNHCLISINR